MEYKIIFLQNSLASEHIYTKPCNWLDYIPFSAIYSANQINQKEVLESVKQYDQFLKSEILFISDTSYDSTYTRLKSYISNYKDRICPIDPPGQSSGKTESTLRQLRNVLSPELNTNGSAFKSPRCFDGNSNDLNDEMKEIYHTEQLSLPLLFSNYLLVNIRTREARLKLLYLLNYIRAIERNIVIDNYTNKNIKIDFNSKRDVREKIDWSIPLDKSHETPIDISDACSNIFINGHELPHFFDELFCDDDDFLVKDEIGIKIFYDIASKDLENIENELLKIGTLYLNNSSKITIDREEKNNIEGRDFVSYDRQTMLMNMYECEVLYYQSKSKLLNIYYTAYLNSCLESDRIELTHIIFNIMKERPLFSFDEEYFSDSYSKEIIAYETHIKLLQEITENILISSRNVQNSINKQADKIISSKFCSIGTPNLIVDGNSPLISLVSDSQPIHPFEIHSCLGQIYRFYNIYNQIFKEMCDFHSIKDNSHICTMKIAILRQFAKDWNNMDNYVIYHYINDKFNITNFPYQLGLAIDNIHSNHNIKPCPSTVTLYHNAFVLLQLRNGVISEILKTYFYRILYTRQAQIYGNEQSEMMVMDNFNPTVYII